VNLSNWKWASIICGFGVVVLWLCVLLNVGEPTTLAPLAFILFVGAQGFEIRDLNNRLETLEKHVK